MSDRLLSWYTLTAVQICRHISVSGATGVRCYIDAEDNQPHPSLVCHLNSSENSRILDVTVATSTMTSVPFPLQEALRDSITIRKIYFGFDEIVCNRRAPMEPL